MTLIRASFAKSNRVQSLWLGKTSYLSYLWLPKFHRVSQKDFEIISLRKQDNGKMPSR